MYIYIYIYVSLYTLCIYIYIYVHIHIQFPQQGGDGGPEPVSAVEMRVRRTISIIIIM